MDHKRIVKNAEMYVRGMYETDLKSEFVYHNLEHVEKVMKAALQIATNFQLEKDDFYAVQIAIWFHDTGYLYSSNEHEEKSAELAVTFLKGEKAEEDLIKKVEECILATKIFEKSPSLISKIVSDADLFHLGTPDFWESNTLIKKEMELRNEEEIPDEKWYERSLQLLKRHRFETEYCKRLLRKGKEENIKKLQERMTEMR